MCQRLQLSIHNGISRAYFSALGVTTTQIAFDYLAGAGVVINGAIRTGHGADFTADAFVINDFFSTCGFIDYNGIGRAGVQAPGFFALCASVWN